MMRFLCALGIMFFVGNFAYATHEDGKCHKCEQGEGKCENKDCACKMCDGKKDRKEPLVIEDVNAIEWESAGPALPAGSWMKNVEGAMNEKGCFVSYQKLKAGYEIPAHKLNHHMHVSVRSGALQLTIGEGDAKKVHTLGANSFLAMVPDVAVQVKALEDSIVQLDGKGPLELTYVNAKDDPRNKKTKRTKKS